MRLESKGNIKYKGEYYMPGTPFEMDDEEEAQRLIGLGVATKEIDPAMLRVAADKLIQAEKEKKQLQKRLEAAEEKAAESKKKISVLTAKLEETKKNKDKDKIKKEISNLKNDIGGSEKLADQLNQKDKEIKKYSVNG